VRPTRSLLAGLAAAALVAAGGPQPAAHGATLRTVAGTVRLLVVDAPVHGGRTVTKAVADVGGRLVDLPTTPSASLRPGDRVTVTTAASDGVATSVVLRSRAADTAAGRLAAALAKTDVIGRHSLTVLPVYWTEPDPDAPIETLTELGQDTADYWGRQSDGAIDVVPQVRDWVRIDDPGSCNSSSELANAALEAHGVPLPTDLTDHVLIYFPHDDDCGEWAGLGQVGGPLIWDNGYPLIDVVAHEFGHNLGLGHANTAVCTAGSRRVILSDACDVSEYRDYADIMGIAMDAPSGNLNSALADVLGLARTVTPEAGGRTGADLAPLGQVTAVRAVKIRRPSGWVYVDYRPAVSPDLRVPAWAGVQLHWLPDDDIPASQLLDGRPATEFTDVALPPGVPWTVPDAGVTVTVTSVTPSGAHVEVTPDGVAPPPPIPVIRAPASGTVVASSAVLTWLVPTAVTSLRLTLDGRTVSTTAVSRLTGALRVTGLTTGRHTLTLRALDATGQVSAPSAPLTLVADASAPLVPTRLSFSSGQVLTWRASPDRGSGVAGYLVFRDRGAPTRVTRTSALARTPVGRHTWWVAAVDRVGNVSPASGIVVVRPRGSSRAKATSVRLVSATAATARSMIVRTTIGAADPR
jgi:hypothetical protein